MSGSASLPQPNTLPYGPIVEALFIYPLKSAAGTRVETLGLDLRGAIGDRRWMVVNEYGAAITQRERRKLALVQPTFATSDLTGALIVNAPGLPLLHLEIDGHSPARTVKIWQDASHVHDAGDAAAEWMSEALSTRCRVVRQAPDAERALAAQYAGPIPIDGRHVALSDGAPLLILSRASIDALNDRLRTGGQKLVGVDRFRPNILVAGVHPHEEDSWTRIRIGDIDIGVGSPCARCVITTIDQHTLEPSVEPLRTLAGYRRQGSGVMFGMNATNAAAGTIGTGAHIYIFDSL